MQLDRLIRWGADEDLADATASPEAASFAAPDGIVRI